MELQDASTEQGEPRARAGAPTGLARTYAENALTLFREDGASGRTSLGGLSNALETPHVELARTPEGALEPAADAPPDLVADLLGDWLIAGDGGEVDAERFVRWLYAGGLELPGHERSMDTGSLPMVHVAFVPELPPDPAFWTQGIEGSV